MKRIILAIFWIGILIQPSHAQKPGYVTSPIYIMRTKNENSVVVLLQSGTKEHHCWGIPQHVIPRYYPDEPTLIQDAAKTKHWPKLTEEQQNACKCLTACAENNGENCPALLACNEGTDTSNSNLKQHAKKHRK